MQLPRSVREIAEVIGRERALFLIGQLPRCYAGRPGGRCWHVILYVPKALKPDHALVAILGWRWAARLVESFGGEILQPANCSDIIRQFRQQAMVGMIGQGMADLTIAEIMTVSTRTVRNLRRENPQEGRALNDRNTAA